MSDTVLLSGCSSGIGRATAWAFLDEGWTVYATARDPEELQDLAAAGAETTRLDVTSSDDARRVVDRVLDEQGRLDCLVNNAGFGQTGPVEDVPVERVIEQYDVNTFGPHRLMRAVLPAMREQESGTIINVSSIEDRFPFAGSGAYSGSKAALTTVSQVLRQEVTGYGIDVVIVEPSFVATGFYDRLLAELDGFEHTPAYEDLYALLRSLHAVEGGGPGIAPPAAVAETVVEAASSDDPDRRYAVGTLASAARFLAVAVPESWRTPLLRVGVRAATSRPARWVRRWWDA